MKHRAAGKGANCTTITSFPGCSHVTVNRLNRPIYTIRLVIYDCHSGV